MVSSTRDIFWVCVVSRMAVISSVSVDTCAGVKGEETEDGEGGEEEEAEEENRDL